MLFFAFLCSSFCHNFYQLACCRPIDGSPPLNAMFAFISVCFITFCRQFCFPLIVDHMKMPIVCCNNSTIIPKNMTIPIYHTLSTKVHSEHLSVFCHLLPLLLCHMSLPHIFLLPCLAHRTAVNYHAFVIQLNCAFVMPFSHCLPISFISLNIYARFVCGMRVLSHLS